MVETIQLAEGITLRAVQTRKFKTGCFSVNFLRRHCRRDAALDALLPSVLLRATQNYPDISSISKHLDELYGASFGTLVRMKGEVKMTGFYADFIEDAFLPDGEQVFAPMLDFLQEVLYRPYTENACFLPRFVEGEKQNLINTIEASQNDKRSYASLRLRQLMCENEDYGVPRLGYAEDVAAITAQELWTHYQDVLRHSRIELFYVGRRSAQEAAQMFSQVFAGRERGETVEIGTQVIRTANAERTVMERMDITQGKLVIGLRTGITTQDSAFPALMLLNAVYGSGVTSKLFVNVREKLSLCYYAGSALEKYKGVMIVSSGIEFDKFEVARDAILGELEACRRGEITDEELESARRAILSALRAALDAPARLDDYYAGLAAAKGDTVEELYDKIAALDKSALVDAARAISTDMIYFLKGVEA
ncbi:MAG: insulinase family protein [Oscillospiraceae bacterium]|nr:insulinase family protein [Oscillospiraceae bacterium]